MKNLTDLELMYAATARCQCGAGLQAKLDTEAALINSRIREIREIREEHLSF